MSRMHRPRGVRALAAAVTAIAGLGTGAVVGGMTASATSAGAQSPAPQHYLCYQAAAKAGFKVPKGIRLVNSLAPDGFIPTVGAANVHCNPALKVVPGAQFPITSPTWHFLGWAITATKQRPATVTATNQFGTASLVTQSPTELLVPSWKSLTGLPNQSPTTPPGEDHYTCYPVSYAVGAPKFTPPSPVMVQDEFSPAALTTVKVGVPKTLCVPTEKILPTGLTFPINNPSLNYVCFKVSKTPIRPHVFDENQFGQGKVVITATQTLCVPTTLGSSGG
jgi:F0F1-type ATP synthase membrane subunit c/vacuolar-type H+-ATPase subunit K